MLRRTGFRGLKPLLLGVLVQASVLSSSSSSSRYSPRPAAVTMTMTGPPEGRSTAARPLFMRPVRSGFQRMQSKMTTVEREDGEHVGVGPRSRRSALASPRTMWRTMWRHKRKGFGRSLHACIASAASGMRGSGGPATRRYLGSTGKLGAIPMVADPEDILRGALNRARKQTPASRIANAAEREKSRAAKQMQVLHLGLIGPLKTYMEGFPRLSRVHPFEHAMITLTLGDSVYEDALGDVAQLRKKVNEICKMYSNKVKNSRKKQEVIEVMNEAFDVVERVFSRNSDAILRLKANAIQLRKLPQVELTEATIALVGAPNVGKSSLVRHLSSGEPEVNSYPFTTRDIKMGHFFAEGKRHQLTDTPGLLMRSNSMRNNMENLTMATLSYLPTSVLFVMDLTGQCGTNVTQQLEVRDELLSEFPEKQWIDVFTKSDLVFNPSDGSLNKERCTDPNAETAVEEIPNALRVSSSTEEGLRELKEGMVDVMLRFHLQEEGNDRIDSSKS